MQEHRDTRTSPSPPAIDRTVESRPLGHSLPTAAAHAPADSAGAAPDHAPDDRLARLLARAVDERARAGGPLLQRLIAVNPAGVPHQDYAIMKQVHQLRASQMPAPHPIVMFTASPNFSAMGVGEDLFIVSHGDSVTGNMRNLSVQQIVTALNKSGTGIPAHFGKIVVLSCYGGATKSDGILAQNIADRLKGKGKHAVEGATGFSFGTREFASTEHSSVLPEDLRVFYVADSISDMEDTWKTMLPSHDGGVLAAPPISLSYVNEYTTIEDNIAGKFGRGKAPGLIASLITHLQTRIKAIEQGLGVALGQAPGTDVAQKIASFEATPPLGGVVAPYVTSWNALLAEQYQLFHDYYLWTKPDEAFASFDSS